MKTHFFYDDLFQQHMPGEYHPESPQRLESIIEAVKNLDLFRQTPQICSREDLILAHNESYIDSMLESRGKATVFDNDTITSPKSIDAAMTAVGAAIEAVNLVLENSEETAFCAVRPPGHHALSNKAMGFCLFNNAAIAAAYALKKGLERVLIFDPDVHHGNGTEEIFYERSDVYYVSIHQAPYYPGTGRKEDVGRGKGKNFNLNLPLEGGKGDRVYLDLTKNIIIPAIEDYKPQLVIFSAGFDAHRDDPLAHMNVTEEGFWQMYEVIMNSLQAKNIPYIFLLEGGYSLSALASSVHLLLKNIIVR